MRKNIFINTIVVLLVTLMAIIPIAHASEVGYSETYGGSEIYMHDLGDLLTDSEEQELMEKFGEKCKDIHYNVLFLTTNDADGKSTIFYADDYMDELFPYDENNIAFVIDMDNREIHINTMGNAILCLTDAMIESGLDRGYEYIANYEYADCLDAMGSYCVARLYDNPDQGPSTVDLLIEGIILGLLPAAVITAILVAALLFRHNKANTKQATATYVSNENYSVIDKDEVFVRSYETVIKDYYKPRESSSSSGSSRSSGGSSHRSSSGRSHGGGSRKF